MKVAKRLRNAKKSGDTLVTQHYPREIGSFEIRTPKNYRLRWQTNAAVSQNIFANQLLDTVFVCATATTGFDLFYAVKLKRVQMWAAALQNGVDTLSLCFDAIGSVPTGGPAGDQRFHNDVSMGLKPAHIDARPQRGAVAGMWLCNNTTNSALLFEIICPANTIVEIEVEMRSTANGTGGVPLANPVVAGNPGSIYWRGLDALPIAATLFVPSNGPLGSR